MAARTPQHAGPYVQLGLTSLEQGSGDIGAEVRDAARFLFVDVDGVFHPADAHFALEDVKVPLLELQAAGLFVHLDKLADMLPKHEDVRLVVHSSWRLTHTDSELRLLFGPLAIRFVGATDRDLDRQLSIFDFIMSRRLEPHQYRVLDDQA